MSKNSDEATKRRSDEGYVIPSLFSRVVGSSLCGVLCLVLIAAAPLRSIETRHYLLHTDVDSDLARDLALRLDVMYDEYSRRLVDFTSAEAPQRFNVYVFKDRKDYARLTGNRFPNTGGIFMSNQELLAGFLEGQGRDGLRRTLQHEAFHQFAFKMISPELPAWLNEGLAQVFEEGLFTGNQFVVGQVPPRRIRQLRADIQGGRFIDFNRILFFSDNDWQENLKDRTTASAMYNQAWAMTHFLVYAQDDEGQPRYRGRLLQMLKKIHEGVQHDSAFRATFGPNIPGFQQRFLDYVDHLQPTAAATYVEHQDILADMLVALRKEGKSFDTVDAFRDTVEKGGYRIEYRKGQLTWNTERDPGIYFKDLTGAAMAPARLQFQSRPGAPLPDIICRPTDEAQLRTIFTHSDGQVEHETVVEPIKR